MDFTLVLLSGETWFKLTLSHGMPSLVQIGVCCPVSVIRIIGPIYFLIPRIHAYITHKIFVFEHLFDCYRTYFSFWQQITLLTHSFLYRALNS